MVRERVVVLDVVAVCIFLKAINESLISCLLIFFLILLKFFSFLFFFSGKDTLVKWWDLDTQHCFKTMVGHRTEVCGGLRARERMARQKGTMLSSSAFFPCSQQSSRCPKRQRGWCGGGCRLSEHMQLLPHLKCKNLGLDKFLIHK